MIDSSPSSITRLARQASGKEKFCGIRNGVASLQRRHADAQEAADEIGIALFLRPIEVHHLLVRSPGAIKKGSQAMVKNVEEGGNGVVAGIDLAFARVIRDVRRERAFGPKSPKKLT